MVRLTRRLTSDLAIWMTAFGILVGSVFPIFATFIGVRAEEAYDLRFLAATLIAGLLVGLFSFLIARHVISPRLRLLAGSMQRIHRALSEAEHNADWTACEPARCRVSIVSADEIGECGRAFNELVDTLFHQREIDTLVQRFSDVTATQLDPEQLSARALDFLLEHTEAVAGGLFVSDAGQLKPLFSIGLRYPERIARNPQLARIHASGHSVALNLPDAIAVDGLLVDFRPSEVLVLPVGYQDRPLGVLLLATDTDFSGESRRALEFQTRVLGLGLINALAHDQLERLAALDPLTGTFNRRFGLNRVAEELSRAQRAEGRLALVMFDIDHFKRINDTWGHLAGDRVIRNVAQTAVQLIRQGDVAIRYGGEEFMVLLPGTDMEHAAQVAERLRREIASHPCESEGREIRVTVSLGVTATPTLPAGDVQALIGAADAALYRAKENGRDRVELARP